MHLNSRVSLIFFLLTELLATRPLANDRANEMINASGGKFVCRTDLDLWSQFESSYSSLLTDSNSEGVIIESLSAVGRNYTKIFECNVGVIAGYAALAKRRLSQQRHRAAYRLLQMAMIFIFTLRNGVQIPKEEELKWGVSKVGIVEGIRSLKKRLDREDFLRLLQVEKIPSDFRDRNLRIGLVTICAYPKDHPLVLKDISPANKIKYASMHGYIPLIHYEHPYPDSSTCIQHSKLKAMKEHLESGQFDWLMWMDCDSMIVNFNKTIDSVIYQYAQHMESDHSILDGLWDDSNKEIIIRHSLSSRMIRASGLHIGSCLGYTEHIGGPYRQIRMLFGSLLLNADFDEINESLSWSNGAIWRRIGNRPRATYLKTSLKHSHAINMWGEGAQFVSTKPAVISPSVNVLITEEGKQYAN